MPYQVAKNKSKKAIQKAVQKNIQGLVAADKNRPLSERRPHKQIVAIAYAEATPKPKKKRK